MPHVVNALNVCSMFTNKFGMNLLSARTVFPLQVENASISSTLHGIGWHVKFYTHLLTHTVLYHIAVDWTNFN